MHILLAEDDTLLGDGLVSALKREGHAVDWQQKGDAALSAARHGDYDLLILDIGLPVMDGLTVLNRLRQGGSKLRVLMLTARDSTADVVAGLDSGADDYLTKPFDLDELFARLRALQRRLGGAASATLKYGEVEVDTAAHTVRYLGQEVTLSRREYALLTTLLERPGVIFSREQLERKLYSWEEDIASNAIEVHIHNIRKKLYSGLIKTARGIGYMVAKP